MIGGRRKKRNAVDGIDAFQSPSYRDFGVPEFTDKAGREYRWESESYSSDVLDPKRSWSDRTMLYIRDPIQRRNKKERSRATPIGGNTRNSPSAPKSLVGGIHNPRWPQIGDKIRLEKIGTNEIYEGHIQKIFAEARRSTAIVQLYSPGLRRIQ